MRELALALQRDAQDGGWRSSTAALSALQRRLQELQQLDNDSHRPKGVALVAALRGKSAEVDALLETLESDQSRCDDWLAEAIALCEQVRAGREPAAAELQQTLGSHAQVLLEHLDREDTVLREISARCLAPEDWPAIVSSISKVLRASRPAAPTSR